MTPTIRRCRGAGAIALVLAAAAALVACTPDPRTDGRLVVAAAFFPLAEIVRNVAPAAQVITVVPPGEEAHIYEPTPKQMTALERADVVFYLGDGFQPSVEKAVRSLPGDVQKVDLLDGLTLLPARPGAERTDDGIDPHVWLDPANMREMAHRVADVLETTTGTSVGTGRDAYTAALSALDARFDTGLADCRSRLLVTGHQAFAYLAAAYRLTQVAVAGISPEEEPSAKTIEKVATYAHEHDVTTIFFEENLPADLARTVADEIGATTAVLDPIESPSGDQLHAGATYVSLMDANLAALRAGLGCT